MITIIRSSNVANVAEKLRVSAEAGADTYPAMIKISEEMLAAEAALFSSQGRRGGGSWKPLKPATVKRKGHSRILFQTGALEESLTKRGALFQILNIHNAEIEFGTDRPLAMVHQRGAPSRNIPRRPFIKFYERDINLWTDILMKHILHSFTTSETASV